MSLFAATFFGWLQDADFYRELHRDAVALLPPGEGGLWIDAGCGPGLVARLAAAHGYRALGVDVDAEMIAAARRRARRDAVASEFVVGSADRLATIAPAADVVSAASLLAVSPNPEGLLRALGQALKPDGTLLVVEPTAAMTPANARRLIAGGLPGRRRIGLRLWARARRGRQVDPLVFEQLGARRVERAALLGGLVAAWLLYGIPR